MTEQQPMLRLWDRMERFRIEREAHRRHVRRMWWMLGTQVAVLLALGAIAEWWAR